MVLAGGALSTGEAGRAVARNEVRGAHVGVGGGWGGLGQWEGGVRGEAGGVLQVGGGGQRRSGVLRVSRGTA